MRNLLFLLVIGLSALSLGNAQSTTIPNDKTNVKQIPALAGWAAVGGGVYIAGFTSNGKGFGGEANLAYRRLLFTLRYSQFKGHGNLEADSYNFIDSDSQEFKDLNLTLSWLSRDESGKLLLSVGGGYSYLTNQNYLGGKFSTTKKSTSGLALEAQINYFFHQNLGLGSSFFGSINSEMSYFGIMLHLNMGLVPRN